tara:strand:- start:1288 stop:1896 length:609 start_codon:yes stop_codon:yes gene_type:complete
MTETVFPPASLTLDAVTVTRGAKTLVRDLSLALGPGAALLLTGANGAGKTTLLRVMAGLYAPDSGTVSMTPEAHRAAAWLGHADGLKPGESPRESLAFHLALIGADPSGATPALAAMKLDALCDRPAQRLSRGQKRRAALARVIASNRPLWLLDEPAGPLDSDGRARLADAVAAHRARGGIVVAATHQTLDWPDARSLGIGA